MTAALRPNFLCLLAFAMVTGCGQSSTDQSASIPEVAPYSACAPNLEVTTANAVLTPGDCVISPSGQYVLTMRASGDLELVRPGPNGDTIVWSSHSSGGDPGSRHLGIQTDGNLVMYSEAGEPVWASGSGGHPGRYVLQVDDAGVAQLIAEGGVVAWSVPQ